MNDGALTWSDVEPEDRLLLRERNIEDITNNPAFEGEVINILADHTWICIRSGKSHIWLQTSEYDLLDILPPILTQE